MQIHIVNMHDVQVAKKDYAFMNTQIVLVQDSYTLYIEYWYRIDESWTLQCQIIRLYVIYFIAYSFHRTFTITHGDGENEWRYLDLQWDTDRERLFEYMSYVVLYYFTQEIKYILSSLHLSNTNKFNIG